MTDNTRNPDSSVSPLAETDIHQLVDHLVKLSGGAISTPGQTTLSDPRGTGLMQGWELASGVELLQWRAHLKQPLELQRSPAPEQQPVWSILLTDSASLVASDAQSPKPAERSRNGMAYLYNHHLALNMLFGKAGHIRMLLIRLKPPAWQHLLKQRPRHVDEFINAQEPRFYGFDLQAGSAKGFVQLFEQAQPTLAEQKQQALPWQQLQSVLDICSDIFSRLEYRSLQPTARLRPRDAMRIQRVRQLMLEDFQSPLDLAIIGREVGLGRDKLRQLFGQVFGCTPFQYYQQQRMQEAHRLITHEGCSAMDAGYRVGYSHLGHFAQAFKKQFGYLPKDARLNQT
ncbi:helix-turn-helix transcriptional regulator [Pseudomaricurvus alkylphenolicus]|uniref:helix-turn-helix transcriptional regulator n=1 Tax=Pseudomaricurvus alkylphenolicus TaxID=1306991 RepID=UPI001422CC24|nr:AraC family transcriptional regulator [Pseudomaricurvus alkylphenolicus]NIB44193.1 helix-turn-helix transcriptional regulator [Pseudomaricurvus alkylphenolicus]